MDIKKLADSELKNLLANAQRLGRADVMEAVAAEMVLRGVGSAKEWSLFAWNQDSVRDALEPFKNIASSVQGNSRTPYSEAGGLRIGRKRTDPEWRWIDSYCAIKTDHVNGVFGCIIDRPGGGPQFYMRIGHEPEVYYDFDHMADAERAWLELAQRAIGS